MTAVVTGVGDKTVTWTSDGGTIVGTNPCVVNEPCTVALHATAAGTYHLTATTNAAPSVAATSTITITGPPTPATTHPRLLVTAAMLPGLQAKATAGNTLYQTMRSQAIGAYNSLSAAPYNWSWSCNNGTGLPASGTSASWLQQQAQALAYMSMIDPKDSTYNWGCYGRDVWTYVMSQVLNGSDVLVSNEWSDSSQSLAFTTDWLLAGGYLSAADQIQARTFLSKMVQIAMNSGVGTGANISGYNSSAQFNDGSPWDTTGIRSMGNNYTESKYLILVAAALTFNDTTADDPALSNSCGASRYQVCPDYTAGSLHAYWTYFAGGMLYRAWAHLEDPNVSWAAYQAAYGNLPTQPTCQDTDLQQHPCFGDGRGGESAEGSWYDYSFYRLRYAMNAMHTAGYDDPILYGPQISMENSSWWDMKYVSDLEFLTGMEPNNGGDLSGAQPAYSYLGTGDANSYYRGVSDMWTEAATLTADSYTGRTDRTNALKWAVLNMAFGGPLGDQQNCRNYCGFINNISNDFGASVLEDLYIALPAGDPTASLPADPRPSLPLDLYNGSFNQHIMTRSSWSPSGTLFSYYAPNTRIDHEHQYTGRFDIYAGNEYITKGRVEFTDYNDVMSTTSQQGLLAIQNVTGSSCTAASGCAFATAFASGGQIWHSYQGGPSPLLHAELPAYVAASVDSTNQYNGSANQFGDYNDVTAASRSLVYLRGTNQVVFYDRATTGHAAFKDLYQTATGPITIAGNVVSWPTRSGNQKAYFTSLLPAKTTITDAGLPNATSYPQDTDWEPYTTVEVNAGTPTSTQFLSVMEWGPSSLTQSTTTLVSSTSGQAFDGAVVGSSLVMFLRNWPATFTSVTYPASGATTMYVSDLTPSTSYSISGTGTPASATTDTAGVLTFVAAGTGNITVSAGGAPAAATLKSIAVTPATVSLAPLATQQYAATCTYTDGSTSNCTSTVSWSSSSSAAVTINPAGLATGVAAGSSTITAASNGIQGQANASIAAATLQSIAVTPATATLQAGTTQQLKAIGTYSDSSTKDLTATGLWTSSNTTNAQLSAPGLVSAQKPGTAIIVVTSGNIQGIANITTASAQPAATPAFSPAGGTYTSSQSVAISSSTPKATIYYTTNGSTPTTSSAIYTGPIPVAATQTLKAIAVASGDADSTTASATFTINIPAATPTLSPAGGTFSSAQTVTISTSTPSATIYYTTNGSTPTTSSTVYTGSIDVSSTETLHAITVASGYTTSATASASYTINLPATTPSFSPAGGTFTSSQTVTISSSTPSATIHYTTNGSTPTVSSAVYSGPLTISATETLRAVAVASGYTTSEIGAASYTVNLPATTPSFSPAGGTYTSSQTVSISSSTPSAIIHYTTDGSTPTASSAVYSGPVTISATETLQAIAVASGYSTSAAGSASYTITPPATTPVFSPAGGTYGSAQTVAISTSTPAAKIYYTTNGSAPTTSSAIYAGPVTVSTTETLQAIAVANGYSTSLPGSMSYTISLPPAPTPTFSPAGGTYSTAQTVTISSASSATIYYTTDGSAPTTNSPTYTGPVPVLTTETLQAIAVAKGYTTSSEGAAHYLISVPPAATPTFSPAGGTYTSAQTVTISTASPSATIFYTTDGSAPTTNSLIYTGQITVSATETLQAIAATKGYSTGTTTATNYTSAPYSTSAVGSAAYTVLVPTPSFSVTLSAASLTLAAGQSGTTTVVVTPQNGFALPVSLSCSGLPPGASCSFSPSAIVTPAGSAVTSTLTIYTSPVITASNQPSTLFSGSALALSLCCIGWKRRRGLQLLLLVGVAFGLGLCTGCGATLSSPIQANVSVIATHGNMTPATNLALTLQ